jgi:hypothetical protein
MNLDLLGLNNYPPVGKNRLGRLVIRYQKNINGVIYYFEEIRGGRKHVAPDTMYKRKAGASNATPDFTQEPPL